MTKSLYPVIFILVAIVFISTSYVIFMCESLIISLFSLSIAIVAIFIAYKSYKISLREKESPIIDEIIKNFMIPVMKQLKDYSKSQSFKIPKSIQHRFFLNYDKKLFNKFYERKKNIGFKIRSYKNLCDTLTEKIMSIGKKIKEEKLIEKVKTKGGLIWVFKDKYKQMDEKQILQEHNLIEDKKEIEEIYSKIQETSKELIEKMDKVKNKWEKKYFIK